MKVCSFPSRAKENPVIEIISQACAKQGVHFITYDWFLSDFKRYDIFHVHWPDAVVMGRSRLRAFVKFSLFVKTIAIMRIRGVPIVWTVHNIKSNSNYHKQLESILWRVFLPSITAFHHLGHWSVKYFAEYGKDTRIIPHPHYRSLLSPTCSQPLAREMLGLPQSASIVLAFGQLRPYKGFLELIDAFNKSISADKYLSIVGRPADLSFASALRAAAAKSKNITLELKFVSAERLQRYIEACDFVVLPYLNSNNSGAAVLALSVGRPIVAPTTDAITELQDIVGRRWITTYNGRLNNLVFDFERPFDLNEIPDLPELDPSLIATKLAELYNDLAGRRATYKI